MNIVALVGFIGCGKDTVGKFLCNHYNYHCMAFADALKDTCAAIFCWDRDLLEGKTPESREWRDRVDKWWAEKLGIPHFTPRWALQNIGTHSLRKHFHQDLWVFNVERRITIIREENPDQNVVITDGRFWNELEMTRRLGGTVIRVKRGDDPEWFEIARAANEGDELARKKMLDAVKVHESEWAWIGFPVDATVENSGSIAELYKEVQRLLELEEIGAP
jgi:Shikimate kinase